jgi:hypothetical protein
MVEESAEGGNEVRALGEPIYTESETLEEIRENVRDAIRCHFEEAFLPKVIYLHFVKDEVLTL